MKSVLAASKTTTLYPTVGLRYGTRKFDKVSLLVKRDEAAAVVSSEVASIKELLLGIIQAYAAKTTAELAVNGPQPYVPFGSHLPKHRVV